MSTPGHRLLSGIRVIDFGWVWAGPLVTSVLADLGAEVIKIEHSTRLDNGRLRGRAKVWADVQAPSIELVPYFHTLNRGKESVSINIKHPRGLELVRSIIEVSDVLVENLSRGALDKVGLGYQDLSRVNPSLVYVSVSAAGNVGPRRAARSYAPITSSLAGLEGLVGYPGSVPIGMMTFGLSDGNAGSHALLAVLAGMYFHSRTKRGLYIDVSQLDAMLAVMAEPILEWTLAKHKPEAPGNRRRDMAPHDIYGAAGTDQWLSISVMDDAMWLRLVDAMERPPWALLKNFETVNGRLKQQSFIDRHLGAWTARLPRDEVVALLHSHSVAASPVLSLDDARRSSYFQERHLTTTVNHPLVGDEEVFSLPWKMSDDNRIPVAAPMLGQHTDAVLQDLLGLPGSDIESLRADGVID